eukprot:scaffold87986_cov19-Tisochrysis_lutea.AAC.2
MDAPQAISCYLWSCYVLRVVGIAFFAVHYLLSRVPGQIHVSEATHNLLPLVLGVPGRIHVSKATHDLLRDDEGWEATGGVEVKGKLHLQSSLASTFQPMSVESLVAITYTKQRTWNRAPAAVYAMLMKDVVFLSHRARGCMETYLWVPQRTESSGGQHFGACLSDPPLPGLRNAQQPLWGHTSPLPALCSVIHLIRSSTSSRTGTSSNILKEWEKGWETNGTSDSRLKTFVCSNLDARFGHQHIQ